MSLPSPHGGTLVQRLLTPKEIEHARSASIPWPSLTLDEEQIKDVKNICRGVFSPLQGFMGRQDLQSVLTQMRLANGTPWTIPMLLDVSNEKAQELKEGQPVALRNAQGGLVAVFHLEERYRVDKAAIAQAIYGTVDQSHPGVNETLAMHDIFLSGALDLADLGKEPFEDFNLDPVETRILFMEKGLSTVTGFQTRNPSHRGHEYLQRCALENTDGLFINPVIGRKKPGDFRDEVIMAAYRTLVEQFFPKSRVVLSILPLRMRYAGPREAVFHAIIRKNFGCSHFVVGRDHAGVGKFYGPYDAQKIFAHFPDLGIHILKFENSFYCRRCVAIATDKTCQHEEMHRLAPSGTAVRKMIEGGEEIPAEFMRPEIVATIRTFEQPFVAEIQDAPTSSSVYAK